MAALGVAEMGRGGPGGMWSTRRAAGALWVGEQGWDAGERMGMVGTGYVWGIWSKRRLAQMWPEVLTGCGAPSIHCI